MKISETCKIGLNILNHLSNTAAEGIAYTSWSDEFVRTNLKDAFNAEIPSEFFDQVFALPAEEKLLLGFRSFSKDKPQMLIPLWLIECLPENFDIEVECIDGEKISIKKIDKDVRFGCVAYMI